MSRCILPCLLLVLQAVPAWTQTPRKPNIIFILADDLGYGELGCYGQQRIRTPHLDRMAAEGMRFTQAYAGSTVCAPSRCVLMTGLHTGHCRIRGNALKPLLPEDTTVAELLQKGGYATGLIGKWGLGEPDTTGVPNKQGFDYFFGYLNQHHAHNYYPDYLWRNEEKVLLPGNVVKNNVALERKHYSHDLFAEEALKFVEQRKDRPFFLYLAFTIPHANNEAGKQGQEVPSDAPYSNENWPEAMRRHAAMITRLDADVGRLFAKLRELKIDEDTLVFFSSDNGPHREGAGDPTFFASSGPLRGIKRSLTEGGIRVPTLSRWPGKIKPNTISDHVWCFDDFLPTAVEAAGLDVPGGLDGISILPTLLDRGTQQKRAFHYWEFHEGGSRQAIRIDNWKALRPGPKAPIELYLVTTDPGEKNNVADLHPEIVRKVEDILGDVRTDSPDWPLRGPASKPKKP